MSTPEKELDISYAIGFMQEWVKGIPEQIRANVTAELEQIIGGVDYYREKYMSINEDYYILNKRYVDLTALSSNYLQVIQELRESNGALLIETQRDLHKGQEE